MSPQARPRLLVVVAGTGTEVGKTWVTCRLALALRAHGLVVAARKPVQSGSPAVPDDETDAGLLASATGQTSDAVCPWHRRYGLALAPPIAAQSLGLDPPLLAELTAETSWPVGTDAGLVELAGGVASPLGADGDGADLARALGADLVVLVAGAGLGTLNDVRLGVGHLAPLDALVYLNRYDGADAVHRLNRDWLRQRETLATFEEPEQLAEAVAKRWEATGRAGTI